MACNEEKPKESRLWTLCNKSNPKTYIHSKFRCGNILDFSSSVNEDNVAALKTLLRTAQKRKVQQLESQFHSFRDKSELQQLLKTVAEQTNGGRHLKTFQKKLFNGDFQKACSVASLAYKELSIFCDANHYRSDPDSSYVLHDYLEITSSSAFRRLQDKAQVYSLENRDFVRSRLTHSLEVSANCERIASYIDFSRLLHFGEPSIKNDCVYAVRCAGLLHDIGNPPFGHYGETVIKEFFKSKESENETLIDRGLYADFTKFDGNAQALRIATKLQYFGNKTNLNLTACVLGALIKYPFSSSHHYGDGKDKFGYFRSEDDVITLLSSFGVFVEGVSNPLSLILEAADDISYATADLEDAIHKGLLTFDSFSHLEEIGKNDPHTKEFYATLEASYRSDMRRFLPSEKAAGKGDYQRIFEHASRSVLAKYRSVFLEVAAKQFSDNQLKILEEGVLRLESGKEYELMSDNEYSTLFKALKKIMASVYDAPTIVANEICGQRILETVLEAYYQALSSATPDLKEESFSWKGVPKADYYRRLMSLVSPDFVKNFFKEAAHAGGDLTYVTFLKYHLLIDFVSGMTDGYAKEIFEIISGTK